MEEKTQDCSINHSEPATAQYILIGLHTCGDLAPTMLRVYSQSDLIVGLVSVGCCYMKVTCNHPEAQYCPVTNGSIAESNGSIAESNGSIAESNGSIAESSGSIAESNGSIAESSGCEMHEYEVAVQERGQVHSHTMGSTSCGNILPKNMSGYPLSTHVKSLPRHSLSYEAREVACHSVETYRERLQGSTQ